MNPFEDCQKLLEEEETGYLPSKTDHFQYNYSGKIWRPCPTEGKGDCFFHSVFGTRDREDGLYRDKYATFRRVYWLAFLTYHSFADLTGSLLELLKKCFIANDDYRHKDVRNVIDYTNYRNAVTDPSYWVLVEEIPILATLENTKVVLFIGNRDEPEVFEPDPQLLGNFPFRSIHDVREVVICLVGGHFSRLNSYDEPIPNATSLADEFTSIKEQNANRNKPKEVNSQKSYQKRGSAGIKGNLYQINLLTMVLLNGMQKVKNFRLSTENKNAAQLDDLIFENLTSKFTVLLQAKHKEDERKKVTYKDLVSVNKKNMEFSLPQYFFSYQEVKSKFKVQNIVICTNLKLDKKTKCILKEEIVDPASVLHFEGAENICYGFSGCCLPELKQNIKKYYAKHEKRKKVIISDEDINDYLNHLQFFPNCPGAKNFDNIVEETVTRMTLSTNLNSKATQKDIHTRMTDWFKEKKGRYLTEVEAKAFFYDMRSNTYCDKLKLYDVCFEKKNLPSVLQIQQKKGTKAQQQNANDAPAKYPKRISHIIPDKEYILNVVKIYQALPTHHKDKTLFVNPDETVEVQKEIIDAFEVQHYTILVMVCPDTIEKATAGEMCDRVMEILNTYKYKHVILIADERNRLAIQLKHANIDYYEVITDNITFGDLAESTRRKFKRKKLINFQGSPVSLKELFTSAATEDDLNQIVNSKILVKLALDDQTQVGLELPHLDNYYITRSFHRNDENISEGDLWRSTEINEEKVILISDSAGMGKSTVLTSLAISIKRNHPHLWVVRFDLNNYTNIMRAILREGRKSVSVIEMLNSQETSKLEDEFDKKLFTTPNRVVLMLDGVDEVSPTYTQLIINLIRDSLAQVNLAKIFVTARPHMSKDLIEIPNIQSFTLEPFSKRNQIEFLTKYWTETLTLQDDTRKHKCQIYTEALLENISAWINKNDRNNFAGIPLQTRMLAEIFQQENQIRANEAHRWEGCKEFCSSDERQPKLPMRIDLTQLYELFIDKKRDIFINEKSNPSGRTAADQVLKDLFDKCQEFHRALALKVIYESDKWDLFTCYTNIEWRNLSAFANNYLLQVGIVQMQGGNMEFIHRTFVEYFVAECLLIELDRQPVNEVFQEFFMGFVMKTREFYVIRAFLDNLMRKMVHPMKNNFCSYFHRNRISEESTLRYLAVFAEDGCARILHCFIKCISKKQHATLLKAVNNIHRLRSGALSSAIRYGYLNVLKLLLEVNETFNKESYAHKIFLQEAVLIAACNNNLEIFKFLMDEVGIDVNVKEIFGWAKLFTDGFNGNLEVVEFLVRNTGADVNIKGNGGRTTLHGAALAGRLEVVKFLVRKAEADITIKDDDGSTALHEAAKGGQLEIVKFLVGEAGADINIKDNNGSTTLHIAASNGQLKLIEFLVETPGVEINIRDNGGKTALLVAARNGQLEVVKYMMEEARADINIKDSTASSALHEAASGASFETVQFLVAKTAADLNIKDKNGKTALHIAASNGQLEIVKLLVEAGANVNIKDNKGRTALWRAAAKGHWDTVKFLSNSSDWDVFKIKIIQFFRGKLP